MDLCTDLGLIDYTRGVKLAGSGFWMYTGLGARLEWALLNYFIDSHLADGYEFILPPTCWSTSVGRPPASSPSSPTRCIRSRTPPTTGSTTCSPTAEAALASVYRDEILTEADLPKKFFAYTPLLPPGGGLCPGGGAGHGPGPPVQ